MPDAAVQGEHEKPVTRPRREILAGAAAGGWRRTRTAARLGAGAAGWRAALRRAPCGRLLAPVRRPAGGFDERRAPTPELGLDGSPEMGVIELSRAPLDTPQSTLTRFARRPAAGPAHRDPAQRRRSNEFHRAEDFIAIGRACACEALSAGSRSGATGDAAWRQTSAGEQLQQVLPYCPWGGADRDNGVGEDQPGGGEGDQWQATSRADGRRCRCLWRMKNPATRRLGHEEQVEMTWSSGPWVSPWPKPTPPGQIFPGADLQVEQPRAEHHRE